MVCEKSCYFPHPLMSIAVSLSACMCKTNEVKEENQRELIVVFFITEDKVPTMMTSSAPLYQCCISLGDLRGI